MSGGVDSSVTAALLKRRGYDVIGITFQMLPHEKEESACCNIHTITDAKRVCSKLNLPHYTINIRDTFRQHVIDPFINRYLQGQTPNPCVECNRHIKFDLLLQKANELGAEFVATGHYCKRTYSHRQDQYFLKKAKDLHKDQTYFLYMIPQAQLARTLFPLGNLLKPEIRALAHQFGLINANRPESQDICFITKDSYKDFVAQEVQTQDKATLPPPGKIITTSGEILGRHQGIHTLTIGQRKGLGIAAPAPLYVLKINPITQDVTVGYEDELATSFITLTQVTLVNPDIPILGKRFKMKSRYAMTPFFVTVHEHTPDQVVLKLRTPQSFVAPGQSGVLYDSDRVVGGGIITL